MVSLAEELSEGAVDHLAEYDAPLLPPHAAASPASDAGRASLR